MFNSTDTVSGQTVGGGGHGFTLVELMLVVVILGIIAAVSVPEMANSIRGNRLRQAASAVVRAGKYSRSMAIMNQKQVLLTFHLRNPARIVASGPSKVKLDRTLDGVRIENFEAEGIEPSAGEGEDSGGMTIPYMRNGRCVPYSLTIVDNRGKAVTVKVDALCGAKTKGD